MTALTRTVRPVHRPFRFGVISGGAGKSGWVEWVRSLEAAGYQSLLITDHVNTSGGLITSLTAAAAASRRLRVAPLTAAVDFRHPVLLAKEIFTINRLWPGRVEFGMGAGWWERDYEALSLRLDDAGTRVHRLRETVATVRDLMTGNRIAEFGWTDKSAAIPILLGGGGRELLRLAATSADIISVNPRMTSTGNVPGSASLDATRRKVSWVLECGAYRREEVEFAMAIYFAASAATRAEIDDAAWALSLSPAEAASSPHCLLGSPQDMADALVKRRQELGFSYIMVHNKYAQMLAPTIERLAGR